VDREDIMGTLTVFVREDCLLEEEEEEGEVLPLTEAAVSAVKLWF